jgi:hypothetical protein
MKRLSAAPLWGGVHDHSGAMSAIGRSIEEADE